jgi:hypothetical protein
VAGGVVVVVVVDNEEAGDEPDEVEEGSAGQPRALPSWV